MTNLLLKREIFLGTGSWESFSEESADNKQVISPSNGLFGNLIDLGVFVKNRDSIYEMLRRN